MSDENYISTFSAARCDFKSTSDGDGTTEDMIYYSMTENECMRGCIKYICYVIVTVKVIIVIVT